MKTWATYLRIGCFFWMFIGIFSLAAEDRVIVVSPATELDGNLDLAAVAEVFKESENLQDFERALNDPDIFLNNLDLNGDGEVDFIRVLEEEKEEGRLIVLQAIMDENTYVDVAYIDIAKEDNGDYEMQIRGEESLYGDDYYYIPENTNISRWPIIVSLYDPFYDYYYSPYSWNHYPDWWQPYGCIRIGLYRAQVIYRYPYRSFKRSYRPWVSNYYHLHHSAHRDYTPVISSHRSSWDYRDRDRRNHDYYNDRRRKDWDNSRSDWDQRNRDGDRRDRKDRDNNRNSNRDRNRRNASEDRRNDRTLQQDRHDYNRPVYQPKKQEEPRWKQPPSEPKQHRQPVATIPSREQKKTYTPPVTPRQPVRKIDSTPKPRLPQKTEPVKRVTPPTPPKREASVVKPLVEIKPPEKAREQRDTQQRKAQPVPTRKR